ncbi:MAG: hypothetical protein BWZ02_02718 [Lentisphaerae bacterium ADurb.BinA184]|nr:MAG: hypothetical protein BWZ02_02718 [Lentisphaerae bacterium ADurb.BinA184]
MPDAVHPPIEIVQRDGLRWTAAHVKPRAEKVTARYCAQHDVACYLPLRRRAQRYQRRTVETFLPMFPGYLFVQLDEERKSVLLCSHKVVSVLAVTAGGEATLVQELRAVQCLEQAACHGQLTVQPEIVPGRLVRVVSGPFKGMMGVVEKRNKQTRVSVNVDILGQSVSVDLDVEELDVEPE